MAKKTDQSEHTEHVYIPELKDLYRKGDVERREFLRTATLLGMSAAAAYAFVGTIDGSAPVGEAQAAAPKGGDKLSVSMRVQEMTDPANFDWTQKSNVARHMIEYITRTGTDNITRPYLAEKWQASDDLKTWTFNLRKGVKWSNGDVFGADDMIFNMNRWADDNVGSSNKALFSAVQDVEKVDDSTVRLHLSKAELAIPENFYNYPTAIVNRRFSDEGGDLSKNPVGTGPYALAKFQVGEFAVLQRRSEAYWGGDVYLDEIKYIDHGDGDSASVAALASKQVDMVWDFGVDSVDVVARLPHVQLNEAITAQTGVARMRVTEKPFDDVRVRQAVVACLDNARIFELAYRNKGAVAENHHVSPIHPEYFKLPGLKQDYALAKKLLADAGHGGGLTVSIDFGGAEVWHAAAVQAMREMLAPAGITLNLNPMPGASYWDVWDKTPFGFTSWTHRPLGVMVLNLGYRSGVPWNESGYANPAFDSALDVAGAILDPSERSKAMAKVQKILQDDAVIAQPLWRAVFSATNKKVKGYTIHPTQYHQFQKVWIEA